MGKKRVRKSVKRRIAKKKANNTQNNPSKPVEKINQLEAQRKMEEQRNMMLRALGRNANTGSGGGGQTVDLANAQQLNQKLTTELKQKKNKEKENKNHNKLLQKNAELQEQIRIINEKGTDAWRNEQAKKKGEVTIENKEVSAQLEEMQKVQKTNNETKDKNALVDAMYLKHYPDFSKKVKNAPTYDDFIKMNDDYRMKWIRTINYETKIDLLTLSGVNTENQNRHSQWKKLKDFGYTVYKVGSKLFEVGKAAFPWILKTALSLGLTALTKHVLASDMLNAINMYGAAEWVIKQVANYLTSEFTKLVLTK